MHMCVLLRSVFCHSLRLVIFAWEFAGCTLDGKQLVGIRHPVIDRHAWFSPGSRFLA